MSGIGRWKSRRSCHVLAVVFCAVLVVEIEIGLVLFIMSITSVRICICYECPVLCSLLCLFNALSLIVNRKRPAEATAATRPQVFLRCIRINSVMELMPDVVHSVFPELDKFNASCKLTPPLNHCSCMSIPLHSNL